MASTRMKAVATGLLVLVGATAAAAPPAAEPAAHAASAPRGDTVFARVGDTVVTLADYQRALAAATRSKYYHAQPPEGELPKFQRQVGDEVVNRVLLVAEARRRGLKPDAAWIQSTVDGYDAQYRNSPNWQANKKKMLAAVVPQLERESLLAQLTRQVREVPAPADGVLRTYYDTHKDLFVEPEQVKLAVILLKVDPSSPPAQWLAADQEGARLHAKLASGADFGELARMHSGDRSAARDGQMEYMHRGMLPEAVQKIVEGLKVGQISEPTRLLEGVVLLRLDGRKEARQRPFDDVRERAADLWRRDEADARWQRMLAELRVRTPVRVDESHYAPLPAATPKPRAG